MPIVLKAERKCLKQDFFKQFYLQIKLQIMINNVRFFRKDTQNNSFFGSAVDYLAVPANKTRLQVTDDSETKIGGDWMLWDDNWTLHSSVNTNTSTINTEKDRLMGVMKVDCRTIFGAIPDALLTTADRAALRLFERKAPSPIVVADYRPTMVEDYITHLMIRLRFINSKTPSSRAMPKGNKLFMETYIGVAGIADADLVFGNGVVIGDAFYTFLFADDEATKTCYFRSYYQNAKGDRSPASLILRIVIA